MKKLLVGLIVVFSVLIILVLTDLIIGIWYWNKMNLQFNSSEFNNILTPIVSLVSFGVLIYAVLVSVRQNRITLSSNIKPHFENKIQSILNTLKNTTIDDFLAISLFPGQTFNGLNYMNAVVESMNILRMDKDYQKDYKLFIDEGKVYKHDDYRNKNYFSVLYFVSNYAMNDHPYSSCNEQIKKLCVEIKKSKLINEDKKYLIEHIKKELVLKYLMFLENEQKYTVIKPMLLIIFERQNQPTYKYLYQTEFANLYNWFKENPI